MLKNLLKPSRFIGIILDRRDHQKIIEPHSSSMTKGKSVKTALVHYSIFAAESAGHGVITRKWADMDGANVANYYTSVSSPRNVVVDYAADGARLYWVDQGNHRVQSGDLLGENVRTTTTLSNAYVSPWGIAILNDRIYVGTLVTTSC